MRNAITTTTVAALVLLIAAPGLAQVPQLINYRGYLDVPDVVPAGTVSRELVFRLYELETGGAAIWTETHAVDLYDGNYAVVLGSFEPLATSLFDNESRYLGVSISDEEELAPRQRVVSVPYAMLAALATEAVEAASAEQADSLGEGAVIVDDDGEVGIGTTSPTKDLTVDGDMNVTQYFSADKASIGYTSDPGDNNLSVYGRLGIGTSEPQYRFHMRHSTGFIIGDPVPVLHVQRVPLIIGDPVTYTSFVVMETGRVGINTDDPRGTLDVNGSIYQRGSLLHADYVFDATYDLESIDDHAEAMWSRKRLPAVPGRMVDEEGREIVEVGAHQQGILVELEKAHIYIEQLHKRLAALESRLGALDAQGVE